VVKRTMPGSRCVVQGCSNYSDHSIGVSLHTSPGNKSDGDKWVRFVRTHRANFNPAGRFMVCSEHFDETCFGRTIHFEGSRRYLLPHSVPTIWKKVVEQPLSQRSRR